MKEVVESTLPPGMLGRAGLRAHMLLGALHTEPVGQLLRSGDTGRLTELLHDLLHRLLR